MFRTPPTDKTHTRDELLAMADLSIEEKTDYANRINWLFGEDTKVRVTIEPDWIIPKVWADDEAASKGHVWRIDIKEVDDFDEVSIDDRDGDVFTLVIDKVREMARRLSALADGLEERRPDPEEELAADDDVAITLFGERRFACLETSPHGKADFTFAPADFMTRDEAIAEAARENAALPPGERQFVAVEFFVQPGCWGACDPGSEADLTVGCRIVQGGAQ